MNIYSDLDFLIPKDAKQPSDIKKTFVYGRPYSAAFSLAYRTAVMILFLAGIVRILICTDAAGMGCNIPNVDIVVQWKLPSTLSSFVQRAGRAARGPGREGLAVLLVEKTVYSADLPVALAEAKRIEGKGKKKTVRQSETYPKGPKGYSASHGLLRGGSRGYSDAVPDVDVPIHFDAIDEGLYSFVQTSSCRRLFLTKINKNQPANPTVPCCDICVPSLFDRVRPGPFIKATRKAALPVGVPDARVRKELRDWRKTLWETDFADATFGPTALLKNDTIEVLASCGPVARLNELEPLLNGWQWFGRYGNQLLDKMMSIGIPPMVPKPKETKRGRDEGGDVADQRQEKRARVDEVARAGPVPSSTVSSHTSNSVPAAAVHPVLSSWHPAVFSTPSAQSQSRVEDPFQLPITPASYGFPPPQFFLPFPPQTPIHHPFPRGSAIQTPQTSSSIEFVHYEPPSSSPLRSRRR